MKGVIADKALWDEHVRSRRADRSMLRPGQQSGALFLWQQDDFPGDSRMLDEFVGALRLTEGKAFGDTGMNFLSRKQVQQMGQVFRKPSRMFFLLGGNGIPAGGFAIGQRAE